MHLDATEAEPRPSEVSAQLLRVLESNTFADSPRLQQFLTYVVNETLAGRAGRIKGYTIAHDVFQRDDPEDAQVSAIVRVEAGRLRRHLDDYYAQEGTADNVRIAVPKGGYVPTFERNAGGREPNPRPAPEQTPSVGTNNGPRAIFISAMAALVLAGGALIYWMTSSEPSVEPGASAISTIAYRPIIAVLPFEQLSDAPDAMLALGLTEDIITDLTKLSAIDVISLPSVRRYGAGNVDLTELRTTLGVTHVLRGSVRGDDGGIRVTAQMIDAATGKELWAERFDRQPIDTLKLQDELAVKVVESLALELVDGEMHRLSDTRSTQPEAQALYKQALDLVNPPSDAARNEAALRSFQRVMEIDPEFAGGYAGAAYVHAFRALWQHSQSADDDVQRAIELADKSISISPKFGLAYTALAFASLVQRDFDQALEHSAQAVTVQPGDPYVMTYHGIILCFDGQPERGINFAQRAIRLDPLNTRAPYLNILGTIFFHAGRYEEALAALLRNVERGGPNSPGSMLRRAAVYYWLDRPEEAREELAGVKDVETAAEYLRDWTRRTFRNDRDFDLIDEPIRALTGTPRGQVSQR